MGVVGQDHEEGVDTLKASVVGEQLGEEMNESRMCGRLSSA